ncbi:MAG: WG repeat-containing protein [Muribaculaceae bacterium]|nr:WG repeat-containing protein [Muribaculaceae bacterium]
MKKFFIFTLIMTVVMGVTSCGSKDNGVYPFKESTKYLTVKLEKSDKWSIINVENGEIVAKDVFTGEPSAVHEDMLYVFDDSTARFNYYSVDDCSKPVNEKPYSSATSFNGGYALACLPGEDIQVIDKSCNTVAKLPASINSASLFLNDRAIIRDDLDRFGFIDTKGDTVIAPSMGQVNSFLFEDATLVSMSEVGDTAALSSLAVIDKNGKKLYDFDSKNYEPLARYFVNGALGVLKNDTIVYLNKSGKEVAAPREVPTKIKDMNYRSVTYAGNDRYMVVKGDRMGLVDKDNKELIKADYDMVYNITPERYVVSKDSVMTIVDDNGKQVGKARFTDFKPCNNFEEAAGRGYINPSKAAAVIMQLFGKDGTLLAHKGATLMDMNQIVGPNPDNYVGMSDIDRLLPPVMLSYHFDRPVAKVMATPAAVNDSTSATGGAAGLNASQFDYNAVIKSVTILYPVKECNPGTEEEILQIISQNMGRWGFGMRDDGTFRTDDGNVVVMGYEKGVFMLNYYFDTSKVEPLPRESR